MITYDCEPLNAYDWKPHRRLLETKMDFIMRARREEKEIYGFNKYRRIFQDPDISFRDIHECEMTVYGE